MLIKEQKLAKDFKEIAFVSNTHSNEYLMVSEDFLYPERIKLAERAAEAFPKWACKEDGRLFLKPLIKIRRPFHRRAFEITLP